MKIKGVNKENVDFKAKYLKLLGSYDKLNGKYGKLKKNVVNWANLANQSTINELNISSLPKNKKATNRRRIRSKLSSTKIPQNAQSQSSLCDVGTDISSIHSLIDSTNNGTQDSTLLTSDQTESANSTVVSSSSSSLSQLSVSLAYENQTSSVVIRTVQDCPEAHENESSLYQTASKSDSQTFNMVGTAATNSDCSEAPENEAFLYETAIDLQNSKIVEAGSAAYDHSSVVRQMPSFHIQLDLVPNLNGFNLEHPASITKESFNQSHVTVQDPMQTDYGDDVQFISNFNGLSMRCERNEINTTATDGNQAQHLNTIIDCVEMPPISTLNFIDASGSSDSTMNLDSVSKTNHLQSSRLCDQLSGFLDSYYQNYEKVYTTPYMTGAVKHLSDRYAADFSIDEYLPDDMKTQRIIENVSHEFTNSQAIESCDCCLCKLRTKNCDSYEFCIKMHPWEESCQRDQPKRQNNNQLKYQRQHVCDECLLSLTRNTKRTKSKKFHCCFHPCSTTSKSLSALRSHFLKVHFKVKPFLCNLCDKDFLSKGGLKMHERKNH